MAKATMLEREVQKQCIALLTYCRWFVVRVNSGRMPWTDGAGRKRSFAMNNQPGCSDTLCLAPDGRFVAIEFKRPGKLRDLTPDQERFLEDVRKHGGIGVVVDGIGTLRTALKEHGYDL